MTLGLVAVAILAVAAAIVLHAIIRNGEPEPSGLSQGQELDQVIPAIFQPLIDKLEAAKATLQNRIDQSIAAAKAEWQTAADADKARAVQDATDAANATKADEIQAAVAAALSEASADDSDAAAAIDAGIDALTPPAP